MSEQEQIPADRIKNAEAFSDWGSPEWRDLYAGDPLGWADNQIRMANRALKESPGNSELIARRDVLFQWRNAYLSERNSNGRNKIEPEVESSFEALYQEAFDEAYRDADENKVALAKAQQDGWRTRRSQMGDA